jgi:hypothetical protein
MENALKPIERSGKMSVSPLMHMLYYLHKKTQDLDLDTPSARDDAT